MLQLSAAEAEQCFAQLLRSTRDGEVVEIQDGGWRYRLTAIAPRPRPPITGIPTAGRLKGQLVVPDSFDEPLDELAEYEA